MPGTLPAGRSFPALILVAWFLMTKGFFYAFVRTWTRILAGCHAFEPARLGGGVTLRGLNDRKGQRLADGVLA